MEGRALRNCLAGNFSEGASVQGRRVTRRQHRAPRVLGAGTRQLAGHKAVTVKDFNCGQMRALPNVA